MSQELAIRLAQRLRERAAQLDDTTRPVAEGVLTRVVGLTLEAEGCHAFVGEQCKVVSPTGQALMAEVVGFAGDRLYLMPTEGARGLASQSRVIPTGRSQGVRVGMGLLGRVLDGSGRPLDGKGPLPPGEAVPLTGRSINPLRRAPVREPLDVGVRAINALLTIGRGQRMGLFAGSGVGKSVLLGMMTRYTQADVIVVGLIGERGREVKEFVQEILGPQGLERAVVVAAPADASPLMRLHGSWLAHSIAEYFRDLGLNVLLLMDSLTRFAQAQREIGLAIGEPPATKGYPPSVFYRLPQLVERAGNAEEGGGSITAFYTVLVEGDDPQEPIADAARAILDGHILLSREIAERGRYPAIDVEASVSRVMPAIVSAEQRDAALRFRQLAATYTQSRDLISVGAYRRGSDSRIDAAIDMHPRLEEFLHQDLHHGCSMAESIQTLEALLQQ